MVPNEDAGWSTGSLVARQMFLRICTKSCTKACMNFSGLGLPFSCEFFSPLRSTLYFFPLEMPGDLTTSYIYLTQCCITSNSKVGVLVCDWSSLWCKPKVQNGAHGIKGGGLHTSRLHKAPIAPQSLQHSWGNPSPWPAHTVASKWVTLFLSAGPAFVIVFVPLLWMLVL